jgi:hypothetical protein
MIEDHEHMTEKKTGLGQTQRIGPVEQTDLVTVTGEIVGKKPEAPRGKWKILS